MTVTAAVPVAVTEPTSRTAFLVVLCLAASLAACTTGSRRGRGGDSASPDGSRDAPPSERSDAPAPSGKVVSLSDQDLAPVNQYIRQRRFLLGDDAEVVASKEFFVSNLMIATSMWGVRREDRETPEGAVITLTFTGPLESATVTTAPRVMIGTGIEVLARRRLVVRFVPTRDPDVPVRLVVVARGRASLGAGDKVERRGDQLSIGGTLRRSGSGYRFEVLAN